MVHPLEVWLQNRVAVRKASLVDLRYGNEFLVLTHNLVQEFGTEPVHRRLTVLTVHQAVELFQLLQHVRLEDLVFTAVHVLFMKPASSGAPLPHPFEATGAVFSTEYIHHKNRRTVIFSNGYCEIREVE